MMNPFLLLTLFPTLLLSFDCSLASGQSVRDIDTGRGTLGYHLHSPTTPARHRAILAPGFLRGPKTMNHLGAALAADGVETAVIDLKRSRPWAGKHEENARDMIALRKALGWESAVYAGFSAGGLSALLAAAEDPACTKLLLLDPVDHGALGLDASRNNHVPTLAILGQPGPGNGKRNAAGMLEAMPRCRIVELADATHCDFEARPSALCYRFTGSKADATRIPGIHSAIIRYSTRFLTTGPGKR